MDASGRTTYRRRRPEAVGPRTGIVDRVHIRFRGPVRRPARRRPVPQVRPQDVPALAGVAHDRRMDGLFAQAEQRECNVIIKR